MRAAMLRHHVTARPPMWGVIVVRLMFSLCMMVIGLSWVFGPPRWTTGPSLQLLHYLEIPFWLLGGILVVHSVTNMFKQTRVLSNLLAAVTWSYIALLVFISAIDAAFTTHNAVAFYAPFLIILIATVYWTEVRAAIYEAEGLDNILPLTPAHQTVTIPEDTKYIVLDDHQISLDKD